MADKGSMDRFLGWIMIAIGALVMLLSGLCSAAVMGPTGFRNGAWMMVLIFGGVPFGIGLMIFLAGIAVQAAGRKP